MGASPQTQIGRRVLGGLSVVVLHLIAEVLVTYTKRILLLSLSAIKTSPVVEINILRGLFNMALVAGPSLKYGNAVIVGEQYICITRVYKTKKIRGFRLYLV